MINTCGPACASRIRVGLVSPLTCHISKAVLNYFYNLAVPLNFGLVKRPDSRFAFEFISVFFGIHIIFLETPLYLFSQLHQECQFADSFIRCALFLARF